MSLSSAWSVSLSGLSTASDRLALVSRNVSRAGDAEAVRKVGRQVTLADGSVRLAQVSRTSDPILLEGSLVANAEASRQGAVSQALDQLYSSVLDPSLNASPAARVADLEAQLRTLANNHSDRASGLQVISSARAVVSSLSDMSNIIQTVRSDADQAIADSVTSINASLANLEKVNREILTSAQGADITDQVDRRDAILAELSDQMGIRTVSRGGNDIAVYTDGGVVLFETVAREVSFAASGTLGPGSQGANVVVDGVEVTGPNAVMPLKSGRIAGLVDIRDTISPVFQAQADEMARALIEAFADKDQSASGKPDLPGLFTWPSNTILPSGTQVAGLAAVIAVNDQIDPTQGGDLRYLRDGGASAPSDPDYNANPDQLAGFSSRILELIDGLSASRQFDGTSQLDQQVDLKTFSSQSVGWLNELRQTTSDRYELSSTVRGRASQSLLSATGVNLDQEMSDLLRFEQSYQAASRLIATVDQMIRTIIETAGP